MSEGRWVHKNQKRFHCKVQLIPEEDGRVSIICLTLPGICSHGDNVSDAVKNFTEAANGAIRCYQDDGEELPLAEDDGEADARGYKTMWLSVPLTERPQPSGNPG